MTRGPASQPLIVFGVTGRMGQSVISALREGSRFHLQAALASPQSPRIGKEAAAEGQATGVSIAADGAQALERGSVALDFSVAQAVAGHARACAEAGVPLLVGATGFDAGARKQVEAAAKTIAVLIAPNTGIGVAVMSQLVAQATRALGAGFDVEIIGGAPPAQARRPLGHGA